MAQLDRDGLTLARYTSDARHLRAIRDLPGAAIPKTHFLYDTDGNLLAEHDGVSGAVLREMIWLPAREGFGGRGPAMDAGAALPVGWINAEAASPAMYFVHADHLGTPQKLTDAAGAIAWDGVFAPFGETHAATGTLAQNLRFPGQFADSESGLSYNWHRYYDPAIGRYLQSDPIGLAGGINSYAYVNGNPLRYTDPEGLNPAISYGIRGAITLGAAGALELQRQIQKLFNKANTPDDPADDAKQQTEGSDACPIPGTSPGRRTRGPTDQREKPGDFGTANDDFDNLSPTGVKDIRDGGRVGVLPDGRKIVVRPNSQEGRPTVEIQKGRSRIKVRYGP